MLIALPPTRRSPRALPTRLRYAALIRAAPRPDLSGRRPPLSRRRAAPARRARRIRRAALGAPLVAINDVLYHAPERAAACRTSSPASARNAPSPRPACGCRPTPSATSKPPRRWRGCSPASRTRSSAASRSPKRMQLRPRPAPLRISRRAGAARQDRRSSIWWTSPGRARSWRYPGRRARKGARSCSHEELELIEKLDYAQLLPHRARHRRACAQQPEGILCQGRGSAANCAVCYCLGITAVDPDQRPGPAVRPLHLREPRRAARHRRRLRARAARGGDAVRLRALRPRPGRDRRHRHPLPPAHGDPRGRQGAGPDRGHHRGAGQHRLGQLGRRRCRTTTSARPGSIPTTPEIRRAVGAGAASCSASRATCRSTSAATS